MALTRQIVRDYVRTYMDLEEEDLADVLIDRWLDEAVQTILVSEKKWPFLETNETLTTLPGLADYPVPVETILGISGGPAGALTRLSAADAEDAFHRWGGDLRSGEPYAWSEWGHNRLRLWPVPDATYNFVIRGYRRPLPIALDAGSGPDLPLVFDDILLSWVMYRAYLQQDDTELALVQKQAFDEGLTRIKRTYFQADAEEPLIFGGSIRNPHRKHNIGGPRVYGLGPYFPGQGFQ